MYGDLSILAFDALPLSFEHCGSNFWRAGKDTSGSYTLSFSHNTGAMFVSRRIPASNS